MTRIVAAAVLAILLGPRVGSGQEGRKNPPVRPDQKRIDAAIEKGVQFLKSNGKSVGTMGTVGCDDLLLLAFLHAGVPSSDSRVQELLQHSLAAELKTTYQVSLHAMVLEELNRVQYQERLWQCGQFLADNQCRNGQWSYGTPTTYGTPTARARGTATASAKPRKPARSDPGEKRPKPPVTRELPVKAARQGPDLGDNSNSQYAALGLRACHDAGIVFPKQIVETARKWWVDSQRPNEAKVSRPGAPAAGTVVENATGDEVRGWSYDRELKEPPPFSKGMGYASMTAGAVGALVIYDFMLGMDWKKDLSVVTGMNWLGHFFKVDENFRGGHGPHQFHYYYLYALERAGILYGTDHMGTHAWYAEGAQFLLNAQWPDGRWLNPVAERAQDPWNRPEWDTCWAILFLKRATNPLVDVASVDRIVPK